MAAAIGTAPQSFDTVLSALNTLQSNVERSQKTTAHEYLEKFQKAADAWSTVFTILQSNDATADAKLFAATTLKGKITYDLNQIPQDAQIPLRDNLFQLLTTYAAGPKPIRTQLCVCLADLAIQMLQWKDVLPVVISQLGGNEATVPGMLQFLHVLPEEVNEGRKINLSEDELIGRTSELMEGNAQEVLQLLVQYAQSSDKATKDPLLLDCITSWMREIPMPSIINSPLLGVIVNGLSSDASFDSAVECLCSIFRETRDVDDGADVIQQVYPAVMSIRAKIAEAAETEDIEVLKGLTRMYAEAGECWAVLVARLPQVFRGLVEVIVECAAKDKDREAIDRTFNFWWELKQLLVLDKYIEARAQYADLWSQLMDIMIRHLEFPRPENGNEADLFDGDRAQEEKFREFRHKMGDVLKDCCEVLGVVECLRKPFDLIENWVQLHGSKAQPGFVPEWQSLEAPLFSMRAMGRMVDQDENIMLPRLIPLIVQIPDHAKVRFQAVMVLGRYTEWTANHSDTLQMQLNFIMAAFDHKDKDVLQAAALSFQYFCMDCAPLLKGYVGELQQFYEKNIVRLPPSSQHEITEGVASVLALQDLDKIHPAFKLYCDPVVERLKEMAQAATDDKHKLAVADQIKNITLFVQHIRPYVEPQQQHPAVAYCQEIFPILEKIVEVFANFAPILERTCDCWRSMVLSYRSHMAPMLPQLANKLSSAFDATRQGCFLWASASVVREFSEGAENVDKATTDAVFEFSQQQTTTFLRILSDLTPEELPDMIEDFFRLQQDVILYFPLKLISSNLMTSILDAVGASLTVIKDAPLISTLHFIRDFIKYGGPNKVKYSYDDDSKDPDPAIQSAVKSQIASHGEFITQRVLTGMMYSFPEDCFPDASGALLELFQLVPDLVLQWLKNTIVLLPAGSITPQESLRLISTIEQDLARQEVGRVRRTLQDFTNSYRRRNVAPREGLGRLEATRFRFSG